MTSARNDSEPDSSSVTALLARIRTGEAQAREDLLVVFVVTNEGQCWAKAIKSSGTQELTAETQSEAIASDSLRLGGV